MIGFPMNKADRRRLWILFRFPCWWISSPISRPTAAVTQQKNMAFHQQKRNIDGCQGFTCFFVWSLFWWYLILWNTFVSSLCVHSQHHERNVWKKQQSDLSSPWTPRNCCGSIWMWEMLPWNWLRKQRRNRKKVWTQGGVSWPCCGIAPAKEERNSLNRKLIFSKIQLFPVWTLGFKKGSKFDYSNIILYM